MADLTPVTARRDMAAFLQQPERMQHFAALLQNKGVDPREFAAAVQAEAIRQPKLAEAIVSSPDTLMDALSVCATSGLLPGSAHGQFYLIPRWSSKRSRMEVTFITGYKGLCDMAYRHPRVFSVQSMIAFMGEAFEFDPGEQRVIHKWDGSVKRDSLDDIQAVYARVELSTPSGQHAGGKPLIYVMTQADILKAKARSETGRNNKGPWKDDPLPMALKTPLRRILSGGAVPRLYDLVHLLGKEHEAAEQEEDSPQPVGVSSLRAKLDITTEIPTDPDEQRAMLQRLRPDEDPSMLSDQDVEAQLRQLVGRSS